MTCGWGRYLFLLCYTFVSSSVLSFMYCRTMAPRMDGFRLDRPHVMEFFLQLRQLGIRAHIWP